MNYSFIGVSRRTFRQAIIRLLETEYGFINSPRVMAMMAEDVEDVAQQFYPQDACVHPGWMVFTGTKATGPKAHPARTAGDYTLVTISWPVLLPEDVSALAHMPPGGAGRQQRAQLLKQRLQRIIEHGEQHPAGPVLLTLTDLGLMLGCHNARICVLLQELRAETGKPLLTKGHFFDQGMRPTHKAEIVALYEQGLDEADIARHTHHDQSSVGRYLRDYQRVKLLLRRQTPPEEIAPLTGMQPGVVKAYVKFVRRFHPGLTADFEQDSVGARQR